MVDPSEQLRGTLYLWPDGILFLGENVWSEPHSHFTASLFWALRGSLRVQAGTEQAWITTRAALVAPNVRQQLDARGCQLAILQIDPETDAYARVAWRLSDAPVCILPADVVDELSERTRALLGDPEWSPAGLSDLALDRIGGPPGRRRALDPRVEHVLDRLKSNLLARPSASCLAQAVGLSRGRLLQLFRQELGLPLRRYILWLRLRHAVYSWALTRNLTEAAHAAGFADSAHLSRTFRSMFGIRPSHVFRHDARVRLVIGLPNRSLSGPHAAHDMRRWTTAAAALAPAEGTGRGGDESRWVPVASAHVPPSS